MNSHRGLWKESSTTDRLTSIEINEKRSYLLTKTDGDFVFGFDRQKDTLGAGWQL
jgi:hypothetical protein